MSNKANRFKNLKPLVADILNLDGDISNFDILNKDGPYIIVHFIQKSNKNKYGFIRGLILDIENKDIVRQTLEYEPETVSESINIDENGSITFIPITENYEKINFKKDNYILQLGHEGVIIDIWKDKNGEIHMSSLKHLNIDKSASKWFGTLTYYDIYKQLDLPEPNKLFNAKYKTSPFVHTFLLSHPELFTASKELIGTGYSVYLGYKKMNRSDPIENLEIEAVNITKISSNTSSNLNIVKTVNKKLIYLPEEINIDMANKYLRYGHYNKWDDTKIDNVLRSGEFIILTELDTGHTYRILSPAYHWRSLICGRSKYLLYNFHILAHYANDIKHFKDGFFPHLTREDVNALSKTINNGEVILKLLNSEKLNLNNYHDRLFNIWLCFLLAVPIHRQKDILDYINKYNENLMMGATSAIYITENADKYKKDVVDLAQTLVFINHKKNKEDFELKIYYIIEKLKKMRPETSYKLIKTINNEIVRVNRLKNI